MRCLIALVAMAGVLSACGSSGAGPLRVGVMLPLTGPEAIGSQGPLGWAVQNVNAAGGIDGRRIQLVYRDLAHSSPTTTAKAFASDPSITAVIGPANSEDARQVVSTFVDQRKVVVSPSATSADLFRAYAGHHPQYFWRPVESDLAQTRTMLQLAALGGATSVALVTGDSTYGSTFFDGFGFLATELGLRITATVRYDEEAQPCHGPMDQALSGNPGALLAVPDHSQQAICMASQYRASGSHAKLLFSDSAQEPSLIQSLGAQSEGLEGTGLAPGQDNGFARAFQARFHEAPTPYAANTYDAVLLLAYGLERSGGQGGPELAKAIQDVVNGNGRKAGWDGQSVRSTLAAIRAGRHPMVEGAVGAWDFDKTSGIELRSSTYEHWRVAGGHFLADQYLSTAGSGTARAGLSAAKTPTTPGRAASDVGGTYQPGPKTGEWALLVAASDGWDNYRHQADVLAQYDRLRANGVPTSHIVVVSANDVARNPRNPKPGVVRYSVGGPNLYRNVHVDYSLRSMTAPMLMDILSGRKTPTTPKVIASGPGDDLFVDIAGHGNQNGVYLNLGDPVPPPSGQYSVLTPRLLDGTVAAMAAGHQYRRMLIAVDACEGGVLGQQLNAPGALLLSAANPVENSLSTNWDPAASTWLADEFSFQLWQAESHLPDVSIQGLYQQLYLHVGGSHVSAYGPTFGSATAVTLHEFVSP